MCQEMKGKTVSKSLSIGVVGAGYVGLATGGCLAHIGYQVTCVDKDVHLVAGLGEGGIPFYEPGLEELMAKNADRLRFSTDLASMLREADVVFIAVDTPQGEDGSADLSSVATVARDIGRALAQPKAPSPGERPLLVNKSTVPVGSGDYVSMLIREGLEEAGGEYTDAGGTRALSRGLQPRIPEGGERDLRFSFSGQDRGWLRIQGGPGDPACPVRARSGAELFDRAGPWPQGNGALRQHRPRERRDDQVRLERLPRHQGQLHQRDGKPLRPSRRRRRRGGLRHRLGRAHWLTFSLGGGRGGGGVLSPRHRRPLGGGPRGR